MSKPSSVPLWTRRRWLALLVVAPLLIVAAGCASGGDSTAVPTQVLLVVTPSPTPQIPAPTPSPEPALLPVDLQVDLRPDLAVLASDDERHTALLVLEELSASQEIPPETAQVIHVEAARWRGLSLDCPEPEDVTGIRREVPGFRVILVAGETVYQAHTGPEAQVLLCSQTSLADVRGEVLTLVDPVAAELLALARRRLSLQFDLPMQRIQLVDMGRVIWPDSSLGCPVNDQTYVEMPVEGYRIVVSVGGEEYHFHTDSSRVFSCDPARAVLPDAE
jgi:hypothetical protein